jgi:CubicO group peptidase (beta-lactamase class C family)
MFCLVIFWKKLLDMSYADAIQHRIFDPLGMTHSFYLRPEPVIPYRASGYIRTKKGYFHAPFTMPAVKHAAGGLGSTLDDMILWDTALREERLLDHATQERMYTPVQLVDGHTENYGLGWAIGCYRQHHVIHHAGGIPGFSAFFGRFPDDKVTIILLSNRHGFDAAGLARKISHLVLDLPAPVRTPVSLDSKLPQRILGSYSSVFGITEVIEEEGELYMQQWRKHALVPMNETSFYWAEDEDVEVHFEALNEQGIYECIRVILPLFWLTAERVKG